ncbi:hypothetical protein EAI30_00365 [Romboutsia ilealis]|uniref:Glucosaminidase domain-containing protein n=1 Tax=Romboutsia faecis TaxID=2764597 RepID=A0ABR7JLQ3_9FIRM|nr:glucosaminidase domain-containing protein [Romboutsia faecis]MBC5995859.1 glucosaminidase domain-containing protein [Romboutsia faecis]MRN23058.1 hypothetical protein [Romboutsia ilealis]
MKIRSIISLAVMSLIIFQTNTIKASAFTFKDEKYETYKSKNAKQINISDDEYIPPEVKLDITEESNIDYLKKKTILKYEVAMANSNGEYTYVKGFNSLDKAIDEVNSIKNSKSTNEEIPVIIDENGIVVYATESIGRLTRLVDGVASSSRSYNVNVYPTSTSKNEITYVNHGYMDDMPIIDQTSNRVKVEINGVIGWIDKQEKQVIDKKERTVTNVVQVPLNQAKNLSYYKRSGNDLIHYMSSNIVGTGGYSSVIGKAPSFMKDGAKYYSYDGNYFYSSIEKLLSDAEKGNHNNSVNPNDIYYNYYLYLPGRTKTSYTANDINKYLNNNTSSNSILRNKGAEFIQAQEKYGVNASFMIGIAMNESGKGTSSIALSKNNIFGLNAVDASPGQSANYFKTVADCINEFGSHWMSKGYFNPSDWRYEGSSLGNKGFGVNVRYASDPYWGEKASSYMYAMDKYISGSSLSEHNKYSLGIYTTSSSVKDGKGNEMYKSSIDTVVPILSTSGSNYKINGDRQVSAKPTTGNYSWTNEMQVSTSSVKKINSSYSGALNQKQISAINKFEQFYIYGSYTNPTIDLSKSSSKITTKSQANDILAKTTDGKKRDRQIFLDEWNKLSSSEKSNSQMQKIYKEYNQIINVTEAAKEMLTYYEYIKSNANSIKQNRVKAIELYNRDNMSSGRRGICVKEYNEATKYGENSKNSERMNYINQKYHDSLNFLESVELLFANKTNESMTEAKKIVDSTLKNLAIDNINKFTKKYNYNQREVINRFEEFYMYGPLEAPSINLLDSNQYIKTSSQAKNILAKTIDGKKRDRQKFLDAWNKLSSSEKSNSDMQKIYKEYNKIINVTEAAKEMLTYYEYIKSNENSIKQNRVKAIELYNRDNMSSGRRGICVKEYNEATKYGENSKNSKRMNYINQKYHDSLNFLESVELLIGNKVDNANTEAKKIKDSNLSKTALENIKSYSNKYTYNQRQVINKFEEFYIYGPLSVPGIDLSNKNQAIKTSSQAINILRTKVSGTIYDRQRFLDAWNKLSSNEKKHKDMVKINDEYKKIISITESARENLKFYENVKKDAKSLVKNYSLAKSLNSTSNTKSGARGSASKAYTKAKEYGEHSKNSTRMKYMYEKYADTVSFLDGVAYLQKKDFTNAKSKLNKIKDSTLKKVLSDRIKQLQ